MYSFSLKELFTLLLFCLSIFSFNIFLEYQNFTYFKENKHLQIHSTLQQQYLKTNSKGKKYWVMKFQNKDFILYTTSYKNLNLKINQTYTFNIITKNINFKDYISKNFYAPSYDFKFSDTERKTNILISYFLNQHQNEKMREFYGALFFAKSISYELRNDVNYYGIAHIIAISGYHIALLFSLIFFLLAPIYNFFQKRFFPYRNLKLDLSILIFLLLFAYAYLIGFVPSYVRSLAMALWGFYLLIKNIKILSFLNLALSVFICISLYPQLLFSVGFLFSILGVFYIFLYLHHFSNQFGNFTNVIFLNLWTFFAMVLPVLYFFPLVSYQQILSIILTGLFVIFYPLVLFLHFIHLGNLLDPFMLNFFNFKLYGANFYLPLWAFLLYLFFSLIAIKFRTLAFFCVLANFIPFIWILI